MTIGYITKEDKRAAIYVRVSTKRQGEKGTSLDDQCVACLSYAAQHGYTVIGEPFRDSFTGESVDRPALDELRAFIRREKIQVVIVYSMDRLARDRNVQGMIEYEFKRYGTKIEYATQTYEDSPEGNLTKNIQSDIAQYEIALIKFRTNRGKRAKARTGAIISSQAPYGYDIERINDRSSLVVNKLETDNVRAIFDWYVFEGLSIRAIAFRLTEQGVKPRGNHGGKKKLFDGWGIATIRQILNNEAYAGTWHYNKTQAIKTTDENGKETRKQIQRPKEEWIAVPVAAIISRDLFTDTQLKLASNKENASRNRKRDYLFSGRLTCACERKLIGDCQRKNDTLLYRCPQRIQRAVECAMPNVYEHELAPAVWDWLTETVTNIERVIETLNATQSVNERENAVFIQRLADIDQFCEENRVSHKRWGDRFEKGKMIEEEYDERVGRLNAELASWERERTKLQRQLTKVMYTPEQTTSIIDYCRDIADGMSDFTREEQRITFDLLNVEARVTVENDFKVAYATCIIFPGEKRLQVGRIAITSSAQHNHNPLPLVITTRLVIGPVNQRTAHALQMH